MTTGIRGLGMTKLTRDLAKRGTGGVTGGSGRSPGWRTLVDPARSGSLVHRVVPAHLACRIGAQGPGRGAVAAAGSVTLLSRAGAAISSQPAGSVDLARGRGPEAPAPSPGTTDKAGNSAQRTR